MRDVELGKITDYAAEDADITLQLKHSFFPLLKKQDVEKVFYQVENPLVKVLTDMEFEGVKAGRGFSSRIFEGAGKGGASGRRTGLPAGRAAVQSRFAQAVG
ncbi:hypothetical protein ACQ86N_45140 [Puia sp. P3]|uniref:hypothetical protein n=1 Tax=Puia sp. P3 TaxID=3423952 RepID=UPI003D677D6D